MTSATLLTISRFASRTAAPTRESLTWQQLVALFADPRRTSCTTAICRGSTCPHKEGACWSPTVFSGDRRIRQYVEAISCLVFDVDHAADAAVDAMRAQLAIYQHLIHTSHADRRDDRCLRVVVQLPRAVTLREWSQLWPAAVSALGVPADVACGDAARCYYLPSRPHDADYFVATHGGVPLDVDQMLDAAPLLHDSAAEAAAQEGASP